MNDIERFDPTIVNNFDDPYASMDSYEFGDYVLYEDYKEDIIKAKRQLLSEIERLKAEIAEAFDSGWDDAKETYKCRCY